MPNPYLRAAIEQHRATRPAEVAPESPEAEAPAKKAAESAAKSDNPPSIKEK